MFYVYVLKSERDGKLYIGHTANIEERLRQHNSGEALSTRHRNPFVLLHSASFGTRAEARWQERKWKTAWGHRQLAKLIPR